MAQPTTTTATIEQHLPYVKYNGGLATSLPVYIDSDLTVTGTTNIAGVSLTDLTTTGNTTLGNAATDTLAVTGVSTFTAGATTDAVNVVGTAITSGKAIEIVDLAALTSGIGISVVSAATAITGAGRLIYSDHTGVTTTSGILNEFKTAGNDETVLVKFTAASLTTGTVIQATGLDALTSGIGLSISSAATAITGAGRLVYVNHTGVTTTSGTLVEVASAANDETIVAKLTAASLTTGTVLALTGLDALTDGKGISVSSAATATSSTGRLLVVDHTGATSTSGILAEVKSAATDETVVFQALASGLLAAGKIVNVSGAAMTTGKALSIDDLDALTTGNAISVKSNSADATARNLVAIHNDHASAAGAVPLQITQDAVISTNFKLVIQFGTIGIYTSNETSPNAALTAAKGSICLNGSATGQAFWNTDGSTAWTALA